MNFAKKMTLEFDRKYLYNRKFFKEFFLISKNLLKERIYLFQIRIDLITTEIYLKSHGFDPTTTDPLTK